MARTLKDYMQNPAGNKAAVMTNRKMYEDLYQDKWDKLMTRENGHIDYVLYKGIRGVYVAHMKIPSESIEKFYYDIVFKLKKRDSSKTLENAEVTFFANDPAFNFTWAFAFKKHNLTIKELEGKMAKKAIKTVPKETNPDKTTGYVKTLYFAYIFLKERGLLNTLRFDTEAKPLDWRKIKEDVVDTDEKVQDRIKLGQNLDKKKENVPDTKTKKKDIKSPDVLDRSVNRIGVVNKMGKPHKAVHKAAKHTKTVGKVKKK